MILDLIYYGNPLLRQKCKPIEKITPEIKKLVADMIETMDLDQRGIGLAAPQVGVPLRLFVLRRYETVESTEGELKLSEPYVYINPKITILDDEPVIDSEGCLSIPKVKGNVERPLKIAVEATDLEGNLFTHEIEGYNARVILHENDHLNGVLFIDRMHPKERKIIEDALRAIKNKHKT